MQFRFTLYSWAYTVYPLLAACRFQNGSVSLQSAAAGRPFMNTGDSHAH